MNIVKQYIASLKNIEIEEVADLIFFRPIAIFFVKVFYLLPITPNQISFISMLFGISSGVFLAQGTKESFLIGGILVLLAQVIDCCDGMIARLKKNGTKTGRIVDGTVDYITTISIYVGLGIGLTKLVDEKVIDLPMHAWLLVLLYGVFNFIHAIFTDKYRNRFESYVYKKSLDPESQIKEFEDELGRLKNIKGNYLDKFLISAYLKYTKIQSGKTKKEIFDYDTHKYAKANRVMVLLWNFIGPSEHIFVFGISMILFQQMIFFYFMVIFSNVWLVILLIIQLIIDKKLKKYQISV
ncbi:MAG: CDP-alcohol phosphatidyltransferase family protein [Ignavibacteriales bacterium]|nr:CDP-alcohol phosphatidyltransferase family protein [Ignavibacteriales bacterium]